MNLSPEQAAIARIFFPNAIAARDRVEANNTRFVHYTTAEAGFNIIHNKCVWMRNALTMNDFSEIQHGKNCLIGTYKSERAVSFKNFLDRTHPGLRQTLEDRFNGWLPEFEQKTFITSLSEHYASEDNIGRLSMWRAYGNKTGIALVVNNTPFMANTDKLKAYSGPVSYLGLDGFQKEFEGISDSMKSSEELIASMPNDALLSIIFDMMRYAILCTKHPGFREEAEWRVMYGGDSNDSRNSPACF